MAFESLRQLKYPAALRISDLGVGLDPEPLEELARLIESATATDRSADGSGAIDDDRLWVDLATEVWRMEKRVTASLELPERRMRRIVTPLKELLKANHTSYRDFTGERYDPDETWDSPIIADGVVEPVVGEMSSPRVYVGGQVRQWGTPIVRTGEDR